MSTPGGTILNLKALTAGYERDLPIVKSVDLAFADGSFTTILGPNGAGKSTLVKAVAGVVPVFDGSVMLRGRELAGMASHLIVRQGMAFVPQTENIFATLTIRENLQLAAAILTSTERQGRIDAMFDLFPDLASHPERQAGSLSGGQRQMLAAARALLVSPDVLLLDEPSAGLSPKLVGEVFENLERINAMGVTIVLVEQNVRAALRVAARAVVLVDGRVRHDAPAAELAAHPNMGELFLGSHAPVEEEA